MSRYPVVLPCCGLLLAAFAWGCMKLEKQPDAANDFSEAEMGQPCSVGEPWSVVRVFYGTDREPSGETRWNQFFSSRPGNLQYGVCEVSIPESHDYGEIERPKIWKLEFSESPDRHIMLQKITPRSQADFVTELQQEVQQTETQEAFLFVHGYNVTFAAAARRAAQMAHDLKFEGPPILFSWPSKGELSGYVADLTAADQAKQHLRQFAETVARDSGARKIHLIAHSMGNRVVTEMLRQLSDEAQFRAVPKFNEIILAAPDVDAEIFKRDIAPKIVQTAQRVTIYASSNDRALQASRLVHQKKRLGQGGENLTVFPELPQIDVVDASWVDFAFFDLGHAEYGDALLADVKQTLRSEPAVQRGLQQHQAAAAWTVPANQIGQAVQTAYEQVSGAVETGVTNIDDSDSSRQINTTESSSRAGFWQWLTGWWSLR